MATSPIIDDISDVIFDFTQKAPVNIEAVGRALGLLVNKDAYLPEGISGHLRRLPGGNYEISASRNEHYYRQRFTLAHEIGHFVLHKSLVDQRGGVDDDTKYRSTEKGDIYNSLIELVHEKQANSFAANLLMPRELVLKFIIETQEKEELGQIPLSRLYKHFQVSASAMRWRIKNLGLDNLVADDA